jgi:asparagine synthase (glutamine-hydrolysing)
MANSLEVRVPLLDHRIVEFAYSLPLQMKLRGGKRKYLLRKVLSRHLPGDHLNLKKKGFSVPMVSWLRGDLKDWAGAILASESPCDLFLDRQAVRQVWDSFQSGDSHFVNMLSVLLAFKMSAPIWAGSINASTRRLAAVGD